MQQKLNQVKTGQKYIDINRNRDGDFWEYYVSLQAWRRGAEVFPNLGKTGEIDLILYKEGTSLPCNVKQNAQQRSHYGDFGWYQYSLANIPSHIIMVCIHPVTLDISWHKNRIPKDWEDFWQ